MIGIKSDIKYHETNEVHIDFIQVYSISVVINKELRSSFSTLNQSRIEIPNREHQKEKQYLTNHEVNRDLSEGMPAGFLYSSFLLRKGLSVIIKKISLKFKRSVACEPLYIF